VLHDLRTRCEITHCIDCENAPITGRGAGGLGLSRARGIDLFGHAADVLGDFKASMGRREAVNGLLPPELRRLRDAIESLQREDCVSELVCAAVQHRAREHQEFLLHRLRVRE